MIYVTPFKPGELPIAIAASIDSGFVSIEQVIESLGTDYISKTPKLVIYGNDVERVAFSDGFTFHIDEPAITD